MHWRGHSADMYGKAVYDDVVADVRAELSLRVHDVIADGRGPRADHRGSGPGLRQAGPAQLGAARQPARHPGLGGPGSPFPLLFAASRKRFIGRLLAGPDGEPRPFAESDDATVALTALAAAAGAWCVRVHEVPANADAVRVVARVQQAERDGADGGAGAPVTLDRISLLGLRAFGRHGVLDHEGAIGQEFIVDAVLGVDTRAGRGGRRPDADGGLRGAGRAAGRDRRRAAGRR